MSILLVFVHESIGKQVKPLLKDKYCLQESCSKKRTKNPFALSCNGEKSEKVTGDIDL